MKFNKKRREIKRETKETFLNKITLFSVAISGGLVGIFFIFVSIKYSDKSYAMVMSSIGQTVIAVSFSSLLLEWFGYVNYTRKRMCEILAEDAVIQVLDVKRKKELKSALIKDIYMPNQELEENNIATIVDNEMDKVLRGYYYKEYILYIDASVKSCNDTKYIEKNIRTTFTAKSVKGDKCCVERILSSYLEPLEGCDLPSVELKKLSINQNDIDVSSIKLDEEDKSNDDGESYSQAFILDGTSMKDFEKDLTFNDTIDVDVEYITRVNIDDLVFTHQIDRACKHYCIHFNVNPNEFEPIMEGFGFMSLGNRKRQREVRTHNGVMLRFLDWILPGDGAMVVLKKK